MKIITSVADAAEEIARGKVVAFPTETVYGLGADAGNEDAVSKIYALKGRPSNNPLIVHVHDLRAAEEIAIFDDKARLLAGYFWPGPLTLVLPRNPQSKIAPSVTAGLNTIAVRVPSHPLALSLIAESKRPIAAPSANLSGYLSSTTAEHVAQQFINTELSILAESREQTKTRLGLESTIVNMTKDAPEILRYGFITPDAMQALLHNHLSAAEHSGGGELIAPGMMDKHYCPQHAALRLNATELQPGELGLNFGAETLRGSFCLNLSPSADLVEAAANLYAMISQLDDYAAANKAGVIAVAPIDNVGIGLAINDRLKRAAVS